MSFDKFILAVDSCDLSQADKSITAGPWHMRFFRLGKIRISQIRMTENLTFSFFFLFFEF